MENILSYVVLGLICFFIGWKLREEYAVLIMRKALKNLSEHPEDNPFLKDRMINIKVELHDDGVFIYKKDDGSYMAHGTNRLDVETMLKEKFPGKMFNTSEEDLKKLQSK